MTYSPLHSVFRSHLDSVWETHPRKVDWLALENFLRRVLSSSLDDHSKLTYVAEALGAYTGRGIPPLDS